MNVVAGVRERAWNVCVPHHARGAALARARLLASLRDLGVLPELAADAVTVVSELVGNAVRHARPLPDGVIEVCWSATVHQVQLCVTDGGSLQSPRVRSAAWDAVDGRGLQIVAGLVDRWGVELDGPGRCVWAELVVDPRA